MTDIHRLDQMMAEADRTLDGFVAEFRRVETEIGETSNMVMLEESLAHLPETALAPLLAVAIRRLAKAAKS